MADDSGDRPPSAGGSASRRAPADAPLLLDVMLGKLTTYLRMCGYDAAYALDRGVEADEKLVEIAREEGRLLVTRDVQLAERADGLLLASKSVTDQLRELAEEEFALELSEPSRCAECNGALVAVREADSTPEYAPDSAEIRVWRCPDCGQHFWEGSHWESVEATLRDL
ncbi:Mut7-C RNAse domain-containing protein [Halorussus gelatinilyticus]|uniref:Mut7-C RNAse domain-containing protein n=1 Tax=Halorussus gelatinilyticus TaxID=2937524 RepID=A0A8U0IGZ2_9EURY|nr:Mut7-C RNAse domain-containing protein [Halorussus gelatinilyticus]UPV99328.1 Mut7-C RNAse domain-containing protein [Halorussus gelatinilyticus]